MLSGWPQIIWRRTRRCKSRPACTGNCVGPGCGPARPDATRRTEARRFASWPLTFRASLVRSCALDCGMHPWSRQHRCFLRPSLRARRVTTRGAQARWRRRSIMSRSKRPERSIQMADEPEAEATATEEHMTVEQAAQVGAESAAAKDDPEQAEAIADQREEATGSRVEMTGGSNTPSPVEVEAAAALRAQELAEMARAQQEQQNQAEAAKGESAARSAPAQPGGAPSPPPAPAPAPPPPSSSSSSSGSSTTP